MPVNEFLRHERRDCGAEATAGNGSNSPGGARPPGGLGNVRIRKSSIKPARRSGSTRCGRCIFVGMIGRCCGGGDAAVVLPKTEMRISYWWSPTSGRAGDVRIGKSPNKPARRSGSTRCGRCVFVGMIGRSCGRGDVAVVLPKTKIGISRWWSPTSGRAGRYENWKKFNQTCPEVRFHQVRPLYFRGDDRSLLRKRRCRCGLPKTEMLISCWWSPTSGRAGGCENWEKFNRTCPEVRFHQVRGRRF